MKGWARPLIQGSKTGSGIQADVFLPDIGSIGLPFSMDALAYVPGMLRGATVPFLTPSRLAAACRTKCARAPAIVKRRQPFTCFMRPEDPENEDKGHPEADQAMPMLALGL